MKPLLGMSVPLRTDAELETAYAQGMLRKEELVHGAYYRGSCRNTTVARWHAQGGAFLYRRQKFGESFFERISHPQDQRHYDVFRVVELTQPEAAQRINDASFERFFAPPEADEN